MRVALLFAALVSIGCGRVNYEPSPLPDPRIGTSSRIDGVYLHGANLPWREYGLDFGSDRGVASAEAQTELEPAFQAAQEHGVRLIRWVMYPYTEIPFTRDGQGTIDGFDPAVLVDLDAAIALATRHNLYLEMVVFFAGAIDLLASSSAPDRDGIARAMAQLSMRAAPSNRVIAWSIWLGGRAIGDVEPFVGLAVQEIRAADGYFSVQTQAIPDARRACALGADFAGLTDNGGAPCISCTTYAAIVAEGDPHCPLVVDLMYAPPGADAMESLEAYYTGGFAGAASWSLLPIRTVDETEIDLAATLTFSQAHTDLGPR